MLLRAWANFSDCGFSRRVFLFRQEFSFSQSYRVFFPSFCQALAEDRNNPHQKKKNEHCTTLQSPLNAFETWADQQELSKEARYKSAFSTRRRVSPLELSMLINNLMEARNQKICKGSWPHSLSTAQIFVLFFTPRMRLKEHRASSVTGYQIHCLHSDTLCPTLDSHTSQQEYHTLRQPEHSMRPAC